MMKNVLAPIEQIDREFRNPSSETAINKSSRHNPHVSLFPSVKIQNGDDPIQWPTSPWPVLALVCRTLIGSGCNGILR